MGSQWAQINFSTLNQRWFNVEPQLSSTILNVDIWLRNSWFCNNDQPEINFSTTIQPKINQVWSWNINVEKWLKFGWQLVDFRLSWFLVDHCYKINNFSSKYQCWYLVEKLICAHRSKQFTSMWVLGLCFWFSYCQVSELMEFSGLCEGHYLIIDNILNYPISRVDVVYQI